jgi:hypothetical protein
MTTGVKVRKRGATAKTLASWEDALIEHAREMKHGDMSILHSPECPHMRGAVCDCVGRMVGPAIRDRPQ